MNIFIISIIKINIPINWFELIQHTNWLQIILSGLFTLGGAAIGANLASKNALNIVKTEFKYNEKMKELEKTESIVSALTNLKTYTEFSRDSLYNFYIKYNKDYEDKTIKTDTYRVISNASLNSCKETLKQITIYSNDISKLNTIVLTHDIHLKFLDIRKLLNNTKEELINIINLFDNVEFVDPHTYNAKKLFNDIDIKANIDFNEKISELEEILIIELDKNRKMKEEINSLSRG